MSEEERDFYERELHADYDELTSGYTTISSNKGDYAVGMKRPYGLMQLRNNKEEQKQEAPTELKKEGRTVKRQQGGAGAV
jgi:hypothetical protein